MGLATSTIGDLEQRIREEELLTKLFSFYYKEVVEANYSCQDIIGAIWRSRGDILHRQI
ncbi:hypothetical protein N3Z16_07705 [Candidatus Megaera polyxenophila]|uniref:hypothetical protein n=1 Tax=Candidatus Megaera polyxenophila TaxID=988779 RepID=UPI00249EDD16|nr:hypothetical protein N3Z16_07705 [Candidatus Megaera polyxenophila]